MKRKFCFDSSMKTQKGLESNLKKNVALGIKRNFISLNSFLSNNIN
jgi:hypothetical protein